MSNIMKSVFGVNSSSKSGGGKNEWTRDEMIIVFGLKAQGASRTQIAEYVNHSVNSIQYVLSVKFASKTPEEFLKALGCTSGDEVVEKCKALLTPPAETEEVA